MELKNEIKEFLNKYSIENLKEYEVDFLEKLLYTYYKEKEIRRWF